MPPTSTHPLFKVPPPQQQQQQQQNNSLNYSAAEPPKAGYYSAASSSIQQKGTSNPWEREEREKEQEIRREQARQWRDQQIAELSSLGNRMPQQEEQLKTLMLERDFERRALEEDQEEDNDGQYQKSNVQEVLRLAPAAAKLKQVDIKTTPTEISPSGSNDSIPVAQISPNDQSMPPPVQPKSILKHNAYSNPSSPSKHGKTASFVDKKTNLTEITMNNTNANQLMSHLIKDMNSMDITSDFNQPISVKTQENEFGEIVSAISPPPPPERNSSYVIMQQQKIRSSGNFQNPKISFNDQVNNNYSKFNNSPLLLSPVGGATPQTTANMAFQQQQQMNAINNNVANSNLTIGRDGRDKRVSFHDHENNNVEQMDFGSIREDPDVSRFFIVIFIVLILFFNFFFLILKELTNFSTFKFQRFIDETAAMLQSPQTPEGDTNWGIQIQSTPGVIGAQEVYR